MSARQDSGGGLDRAGPWMGLAFVVLFVVGFMAFPTPSDNTQTLKWQRWWTDSGHRTGAIIGAYLMVLGALAFVWFMWSVRRRLDESGGVLLVFGSLFAGVLMVSTMVRASIPGSKEFGNVPVPAGDFSRQFDQIGFGLLLVAGALSAGAFLAVLCHAARKHALLPGWLTIAGYVVAVLQLAAATFLPFALFPLWVLVASIVLLVRAARTESRVAAVPATA